MLSLIDQRTEVLVNHVWAEIWADSERIKAASDEQPMDH
jgi:hypothetical protein